MSAVVDGDKVRGRTDAMLAEVERMKAQADRTRRTGEGREAIRLPPRWRRGKTMQGQRKTSAEAAVSKRPEFSARYLAAVQRIAPADLQRWLANI